MAKKTEKSQKGERDKGKPGAKARSSKSTGSKQSTTRSSGRSSGKSTSSKTTASKQAKGTKSGSAAVRPAPSTTEGLSEEQRKLIEKIEDALPQLDVETLALVLRNTQVAIYNRQMEDTRRQVEEAQKAVEQGRVPGEAKAAEIDIEQISGYSFVIVYGPERVFFNRAELREIARVCWATGNEKDGAARLYKWFERERRDFLLDTGIDSGSDPGLRELWNLVRSRYKVS